MAGYTYTFGDFPQGETLDDNKFAARIAADVGITTAYEGCIKHEEGDGQVIFIFESALEPSEETALDALVAAYVYETLDEVKVRCIQECKDWRDMKMNMPIDVGGMSVEYPASSGKLWSIGFIDQQYWDALYGARDDLSYPVTLRTWNEMDSHSFSDANEIKAIYNLVRSTVLGEIEVCDAAIGNIVAATDVSGAEAAAAAYVGT